MDNSIQTRRGVYRRVFLVGCPRSGTTILQRCISSHSRITSFPETDFFAKLIGRRKGKFLARINRVKSERCNRAWEKMERVFGKDSIPRGAAGCVRFDRTVGTYIDFLDSISCSRGCDIWLEKTPRHFRYTDIIERVVPRSTFVHVVRDGRAVVGSIVDRAIRYPDRFGGETDPVNAAKLWNEAIQRTAKRIGNSNDVVVHHDTLVEKPGFVLESVCKRLGISYESEMISGAPGQSITEPGEAWKESVNLGVINVNDKFEEVLSESERRRVCRILDWSTYRYLRAYAGCVTDQSSYFRAR